MIALALCFGPLFAHADVVDSWRRATPGCATCTKLDRLLERSNAELSADARLSLALDVAKVIAGVRVKGKPTTDRKREIWFSINASLQILPDDFDSETVVRLLDLRTQDPAGFDDVLWHFQKGEQEKIVKRMQALKDDKIRPSAVIPVIKELN